MATTDYTTLLASIRDQRTNNPLSILNLAEPLLTEQTHPTTSNTRDSINNETSSHSDSTTTTTTTATSTSQPTPLNPTTLTADLTHYRDLFSKLRFSYLEQVTKEKYLRSIVGDPPILVSTEDNAILEDRLAGMKADLKRKKEMNEMLVVEIEVLASQLAERWDYVNGAVGVVEGLPAEIELLEAEGRVLIEEVKRREREVAFEDGDNDGEGEDVNVNVNGEMGNDPRMNMSLADTQREVEEQKAKIREVDEQIAALEAQVPVKIRECEKAERELGELEVRRNEVTRLAREVLRLREEGGRDPLEDQDRWWRAQEAVLKGLLGTGIEA